MAASAAVEPSAPRRQFHQHHPQAQRRIRLRAGDRNLFFFPPDGDDEEGRRQLQQQHYPLARTAAAAAFATTAEIVPAPLRGEDASSSSSGGASSSSSSTTTADAATSIFDAASLGNYAALLFATLLAWTAYLLLPRGIRKAYCGSNRKRHSKYLTNTTNRHLRQHANRLTKASPVQRTKLVDISVPRIHRHSTSSDRNGSGNYYDDGGGGGEEGEATTTTTAGTGGAGDGGGGFGGVSSTAAAGGSSRNADSTSRNKSVSTSLASILRASEEGRRNSGAENRETLASSPLHRQRLQQRNNDDSDARRAQLLLQVQKAREEAKRIDPYRNNISSSYRYRDDPATQDPPTMSANDKYAAKRKASGTRVVNDDAVVAAVAAAGRIPDSIRANYSRGPTATHPAVPEPPSAQILAETLRRLQTGGARLLAHGIQSAPKKVWISYDSDTTTLNWQTEVYRRVANASGESSTQVRMRGALHAIAVPNIVYVDVGKKTSALQRQDNRAVSPDLCFSLLTASGSLDLQANSRLERDALVCCLSLILDRVHPQQDWRHLYESSPEPSLATSGNVSSSSTTTTDLLTKTDAGVAAADGTSAASTLMTDVAF